MGQKEFWTPEHWTGWALVLELLTWPNMVNGLDVPVCGRSGLKNYHPMPSIVCKADRGEQKPEHRSRVEKEFESLNKVRSRAGVNIFVLNEIGSGVANLVVIYYPRQVFRKQNRSVSRVGVY